MTIYGRKYNGKLPSRSYAAHRTAEARRCPKCGRGSAIKRFSDEYQFGSYCRWDDCGYENVTQRGFDD